MVPNQPVYSHEAMKNIIGSIAQSSIMRLDPMSMNKLWDLVTTVFKWQAMMCSDILKVTQRHLSELENYVSNGETLLQLRKVCNIFDNLRTILIESELLALRSDLCDWFKNSNIKVSLLLKMGLQNSDGSFVMTSDDEVINDALRNLGQNIYTLNGSVKIPQINRKEFSENGNEVNFLVGQLLGNENANSPMQRKNLLKLDIGSGKSEIRRTRDSFQSCCMNHCDNKFEDLLSDLNIQDNCENPVNFKDDLLNLMVDD